MLRNLFTFSSLITSFGVLAQITITSNDLPEVGDIYNYRAASIFGVQTNNAGTNQNWNYSNLGNTNSSNDEFISIASTNFVYALVFGTPLSPNMANMAKEEENALFIPPQAGFSIEEPFAFYRKRNQDFSQVGLGVKVQDFPVPVRYNPPDRIYKFPLAFGNRDTANFAYNIDVPTLGYYGRKGTRINYVDGWGTLTLPGGLSFECIRVRSEVSAVDSIQIDTLSVGFNVPVPREIKYKWLAPGYAWPILEITVLPVFTFEQVTSVKYFYEDATAVENSLKQNHVEVFPNPTNDNLFIRINHAEFKPKTLQITDISGKLIYSKQLPPTLPFIELNNELNMLKGIYFLTLSDENRSISQKIVKL